MQDVADSLLLMVMWAIQMGFLLIVRPPIPAILTTGCYQWVEQHEPVPWVAGVAKMSLVVSMIMNSQKAVINIIQDDVWDCPLPETDVYLLYIHMDLLHIYMYTQISSSVRVSQ